MIDETQSEDPKGIESKTKPNRFPLDFHTDSNGEEQHLSAPLSVATATFNSLSDMPPAVKTLSTRYAIKLLGNPATIVAKRMALEGEAIMTIAADHMLALLLPDAFDRVSYQPLIGVPLSMFEYFLYTGLILDDPVRNAGVHFAMEPTRLAQLFQGPGRRRHGIRAHPRRRQGGSQ